MRASIFETRTGRSLIEVEVVSWSYDTGILAPDNLSAHIPAYTLRSLSMDMRQLLTARKYSVALIDDAVEGERLVPAAGSIEDMQAGQDDDGRDGWSVSCIGPERVLQLGARVRKYPGWPLVDASTLLPTGTYDMTIAGVEYGTIMKRLVVESMKFPGGQLPITFEPDRAGTRARTYAAIDGKKLVDALDDLSDLVNGVEYDFQASIAEDDSISYRLATGTDARKVITGPASGTLLNLGGDRQDVRGWSRRVNPGSIVTDSIFVGGKDDDKVLMARSSSSSLIDQGWPRAELWDTSHSTVSELPTLQSWADGAIANAAESAKLDVRYEVGRRLRHGDFVKLDALGHWDMPDGETDWRVLAVARSSDSEDWLSLDLVR